MRLRESDEHEGLSTCEVLTGLYGVCEALQDQDYMRGGMDVNPIERLARAAEVLAAILYEREEM